MELLQTDPLIYATPIKQRPQPAERSYKKLMNEREIALCINCPLPRCQSYSRECPIRPVTGHPGASKNSISRVPPATRRALTKRHGLRVQKYLRAHGATTCNQIAADLNTTRDDIHAVISSLVTEHGATIIPRGMQDHHILYTYATGTERRPIINTNR